MASDRRTAAIVLAAGDGKRLKSDVPKVLHDAAGRPLLVHVLAALEPLDLGEVVVVASPRKSEIESAVSAAGLDVQVRYAVQETPSGTGDAVRVGLDAIGSDVEHVLVLSGDSPLLRTSTLATLLERHGASSAVATVLTAVFAEPTGYGRIIKGASGDIERIVEERDAKEDERMVREINAGTYAFDVDALKDALPKLGTDNAEAEYYLTETVALMLAEGKKVEAFEGPAREAGGVNSRQQLSQVAQELRARACERWMAEGVTIVDPDSTFIDAGVTIGRDAVILPFTFLEGETQIGARARIGPQVRIVDSSIGEETEVTFAVVRESEIGPDASIGPFASVRKGTTLGRGSRIGTFVETKQTSIGDDSKASHLAYLGDAKIGRGVNVGAGTITCNWDGQEKHETVIEDEAYIGSDTMLVAPTHIGKRAATGAGSVVRGDVPDDALAVGVPARVIPDKGDKMGKGPGKQSSEPRE
jgi:bifunctional UDP-N-acetylglucosamine pyrophosphorylase / glucosamine-1-phosphate N-acetyltransferase